MCYPSGGGDNGSAAARAQEEQRQAQINQGMDSIDKTFAPFNDQYYADFEKKNLALATPDIAKQKQDATNQTLYGLARSGNLDSSTAAKQYGDIENRNTQAIQQASDTAHNAAQGLRSDVEAERSNLTSQLNASADAGAAANEAATQAKILTRPPTYSPVTNIFSDLTGQIAANEQARIQGYPGWGFGIHAQTGNSPLPRNPVITQA
jgi:hypothetical protein